MQTVAAPCLKCGGTERQACGRCVGCRKAQRRAAAKRATHCRRCKGADLDAWGYCKPCRAARGAAKVAAGEPCAKCGSAEKYSNGECKPCEVAYRAERASRLKACPGCGSSNLFPGGACRDCQARNAARIAAEKTPCGVCGSTERNKRGACKPCGRKHNRKHKYGLTDEGFRALVASQSGRCAACGDDLAKLPPKEVHIDHDHVTGAVRGVLCQGCNTAIGSLKDSPLRARKLADYLTRNAPALPFARKGAA